MGLGSSLSRKLVSKDVRTKITKSGIMFRLLRPKLIQHITAQRQKAKLFGTTGESQNVDKSGHAADAKQHPEYT